MNDTDPEFDPYPCQGVCRVDPESGCCLGCGRPLYAPSANATGAMAEETEQPATNQTRA